MKGVVFWEGCWSIGMISQVCWRCMNRSSKDADFGQAGPPTKTCGGLLCHIVEVDEGFDLRYFQEQSAMFSLLWQERSCLL